MGAIVYVISFFVVMIALIVGFYLQYLILVKIGATEFMWLLFMINIPLVVLGNIIAKAIEAHKSKKVSSV